MNFDKLNDENIVLFAMKHYDNPACKGIEEFNDDFNRIKYIKRLFNRYESNGNLKERLILNHIITFFNVFGIPAANRLLFNRIEEKHYTFLKPFLVYLNYCPEDKVNGIDVTRIPLDNKIINTLRGL
jgi:hypothetical protein